MPISLKCYQCAQPLLAPDDRAGQLIRCPHCDAFSTVPAHAPGTVPVVEPIDEPAEGESPPGALSLDDEPEPVARPWDAPSPRRRPLGHWQSFASGCNWVKKGLLIELLGFVCLIAIFEILILVGTDVIKWEWLKKPVASSLLLPVLGFMLLGACLIGLGRVIMLRMPHGTGDGGVLGGAMAMSCLRVIAMALAVVFLIMALLDDFEASRMQYYTWVARMWGLAMLAGLIAEVSIVPGFAIVGGVIPNAELRRKAGFVSLIFQLMAVVYVAMIISMFYVEAISELLPRRAPRQGPPPAAKPRAPMDPGLKIAVGLAIPLILFMLQAAYTFLHYSLYATGQRAAVSEHDRDT